MHGGPRNIHLDEFNSAAATGRCGVCAGAAVDWVVGNSVVEPWRVTNTPSLLQQLVASITGPCTARLAVLAESSGRVQRWLEPVAASDCDSTLRANSPRGRMLESQRPDSIRTATTNMAIQPGWRPRVPTRTAHAPAAMPIAIKRAMASVMSLAGAEAITTRTAAMNQANSVSACQLAHKMRTWR